MSSQRRHQWISTDGQRVLRGAEVRAFVGGRDFARASDDIEARFEKRPKLTEDEKRRQRLERLDALDENARQFEGHPDYEADA